MSRGVEALQQRISMVFIAVLAGLLMGLLMVTVVQVRRIAGRQRVLDAAGWMDAGHIKKVDAVDPGFVKGAVLPDVVSEDSVKPVFSSELRVVAIGSGYPIPFDAEVCPFTGAVQPALNQLDRDNDGMTDDWEMKYGFDKLNSADAMMDKDGDGFTNLEEFIAKTNPLDRMIHPPVVTKLRLKQITQKPFKFIFKGVTEQPDGRRFFQLYEVATGKSVWKEIGDEIDGLIVKSFILKDVGGKDRLIFLRGDVEIVLPKLEKAVDPESEVELINMLDQQSIIVTMGALLSLRNDVYSVDEVGVDRIVVRDQSTGLRYDIVGLTEEER